MLLLAGLASCGPRRNVVRIAVAVPLTGDTGTEGQGLLRGVGLAVEEANAAKRFPYNVEVRAFDDRADPREAVNVANLIASDLRVAAVVGPYTSGCALAAARVYARAGLPLVVPSATSPEVTRQQLSADWPGPRNVFRVCPTDDEEGAVAGAFIRRRLGLPSLAIVYEDTPYGQGIAREVRKRFMALGGKVVRYESVSGGEKDFKPLLSRVRLARPAGLYFAGLYTEGGLLLKQLRAEGMPLPFISGDGLKTDGLFAVAGPSAEGAFVTMVGAASDGFPRVRDFERRFKERYGQEIKPYDPFAYEAASIILDALAAVGHDRAKLIERMRATDREGILGRTRFDEKGDTMDKAISISRVDWRTRGFVSVQ